MQDLCFSRLQSYALEAFQLAHRPHRSARALMDVQLRDFISRPLTGIAHVDGDSDLLSGGISRFLHMQICVFERGVAETKSKRIGGRAGTIPISFVSAGRILRGKA